MGRTLILGKYKITTEENEHGAYKAQVFLDINGNLRLQAEYYGPTEHTAIIRATGAALEVFGEHKALLVALLSIGYADGYVDGYDMGEHDLEIEDDLSIHLMEIEEILNT